MHYRIVVCVLILLKSHIYEDNILDRKLKCEFQIKYKSQIFINLNSQYFITSGHAYVNVTVTILKIQNGIIQNSSFLSACYKHDFSLICV